MSENPEPFIKIFEPCGEHLYITGSLVRMLGQNFEPTHPTRGVKRLLLLEWWQSFERWVFDPTVFDAGCCGGVDKSGS